MNMSHITGNTIQDVFSAIVLRGFNHTIAPYDFYDQTLLLVQMVLVT